MKLFFGLVLIFLLPLKWVPTKIKEGIIVPIPSEMRAMTDAEAAQHSPSIRTPLGAFTTNDQLVDFVVSVSATQWPDLDLNIAKQFFRVGVTNLYDKVTFIRDDIVSIHKKNFIRFEFESRINGDKTVSGRTDATMKYHYILYFLQPKRAIVFSF
ncbi:MAG: hypothetical protein CRN43_21090, partial [Candidatus Nephrothrix sp. EaCA]